MKIEIPWQCQQILDCFAAHHLQAYLVGGCVRDSLLGKSPKDWDICTEALPAHEYVRTVVECYKEAIKAYLEGTFTDEKIAAWDERLKTVFNRGFWDGYYLGQRLGEWTRNYGSAATERKIYVGKGIKYFSNIGVSEFLVEAAEVSVGDKLLISGPTTGALFMTLEEARVDLESVQTVKKGQHFSMKSDKIRPSDKLYKLVSTEELKKFKGLDIEQKRG